MIQGDGNKTLVFEVTDRVLRSWWTLFAGVCLGIAGAQLLLHFIPKVYEATTKIWITEQQIPKDVVNSTVNADMSRRLLAFKESVLDRPYMIELIERTFGLPETEEELRELMRLIRSRVRALPSRTEDLGLLSFEVTYRDSDPQRTANVVNTMSRLYVEQNAEFRANRADRTAETIDRMAQRAKEEYDKIDRLLTAFVKEHQFETEEYLAVNFKLLETRQKDLEINMNTRNANKEQIKYLEEQMQQARLGVPTTPTENPDEKKPVIAPMTQRIAQVQRELDELRITYSDRHPTYVRKKRELEDLLAQARAQNPGMKTTTDDGEPAMPPDPVVATLLGRIKDMQASIETLRADEQRLRREIAEYERRINVEPEVQRKLNELREEHAVLRDSYRKLERDAERAKGSQALEYGQLGQRLEVLEYAAVPSRPVAPQPIPVYGLGLIAGVTLFVGPIVLRHMLNPVISSESGLRATSAFPVLVTVPRIISQQTQGLYRRRLIKNLGFSMVSTALLFVAVVFLR